jgi:hypothetical protein
MRWVSQSYGLSINRQCDLACIPRISWYYELRGESAENLLYMRMIDEQYVIISFYGAPRMSWVLRQRGYKVNENRVSRLIGLMGIQAIYPRKTCQNLRLGTKYIPSRYVLSWRLSNTTDTEFCILTFLMAWIRGHNAKYLTLIRAVSSPRQGLRRYSKTDKSESVWMVKEVRWIMFLPNVSGVM